MLAVFVVRWVSTLFMFVLGMYAPGMVSIERRGQFTYRELTENNTTKVLLYLPLLINKKDQKQHKLFYLVWVNFHC